jgi:GNAT superfamily N-acetyltransferase
VDRAHREAWLERIRESMVAAWEMITRTTRGGRAIRRDGVFASIVPATPERSVMNSVIYSDREAMLGSLEELAHAYDEAGVNAWTVWVPEGDVEAATALERAGHAFDAEPRAMGMDLSRATEPGHGGIEWSRDCELITIGRINDAAYGYEDGTLESVISSLPVDRVHPYAAHVGGDPAAVMMTIDCGDDTEIAWVATTEVARGRGLATALMRQSLWDARDRGQRTATLQATKLGAPIYERVGFDDFGALHMWERRR